LLKRGFKSKAEKLTTSLRQVLCPSNSDPLIGTKLAKHLQVRVSSANRIPRIPIEIMEQLWEADSTAWSAFTITHPQMSKWVLYNPTHSTGRHESNVMHEMAHILCEHEPSKFVTFEGCTFALRTCNPEQEEEANWLSGCLKLPRESLLWAVGSKMSNAQIAAHFVTSLDMVQFRRNVTGIDRQIQRQKIWANHPRRNKEG
jgi:Zn-dependent peptidase ImmA (M78 family)